MKLLLLTLACMFATAAAVQAAPNGALQSIRFEMSGEGNSKNPSTVVLAGPDAARQLLVTGTYAAGAMRDLTREVKFVAKPADVVAIDRTGVVTARKEGTAEVTAQMPGVSPTTISITVRQLADAPPVGFSNEVVPVLSKLGCNTGGCHGKASGQNGFKLSLFGFEPFEDHEFLVKEARGRRLSFSAPDRSLILLKGTAQMPHGGGKRLDRDSPYYALLHRWIGQGAPHDPPNQPEVLRIEVLPHERLTDAKSSQQIAVLAHFDDGSIADVTRLTQFEVNQSQMATVSAAGLVAPAGPPGTVAVMARYQSQVDVLRLTIPLGSAVPELPPAANFIDEFVYRQWQELGLPPSAACDDGTFIRRVTLDIAGRLPTKDETVAYRNDTDPRKHEKLVDRLLDSGDYADYFANKWSAVLRNRRPSEKDDAKPTAAFHAWIRDSLAQNKPFDEFVREILTATGELDAAPPPVVWYREVKDTTAQLEDVAQLFLGQRIQCARCHHHPLEKWSQQDYYGLAAFFTRLEIKVATPSKKGKKGEPDIPGQPFRVSFKPGKAQAMHPRTNRPVKPAGLGGPELEIDADTDPRGKLVDWLTAADNPYFARTLANRYWKHFFGRGLAEPEDDLRVTNPPSNPGLLDALAEHFVSRRFDLKDLVRTICTSRVYRLSVDPNAHNAGDTQSYSRFLPRRLPAEVLLDAIDAATGSKTQFKGVSGATRAVQLPDNQFESYFLSTFGRPDSASACECERSGDASLAQALHLFNSEELLEKISGRRASLPESSPPDKNGKKNKAESSAPATPGPIGGRIKQILSDPRDDREKLADLYLIAFSREPTNAELENLLAHIAKKPDAQTAYEDILWAVINTKEFLYNH